MKSTLRSLTIAMGLAALTTGIAAAQSMKADIPFAFRVGEKAMPAGTYQLSFTGDLRAMLIVRNSETKTVAMVVPTSSTMAPKAWTAGTVPMIGFACGTGRCALAQLWNGESRDALVFAYRAPKGVEHAALTEIRLMRLAD